MKKKRQEEKGRVNSGEQDYSSSSRSDTNNGIAVHVHQQDHCMNWESATVLCTELEKRDTTRNRA